MAGERIKVREDLSDEITACQLLIASSMTRIQNLERVVRADHANRYQLWHEHDIRAYNMKTVQEASVSPLRAIQQISQLKETICQTNREMRALMARRDDAITLEIWNRSKERETTFVPEEARNQTGSAVKGGAVKFKLRCFIKKEVASGNVLDDKDDAPNLSKPKKNNNAGAAGSSNLHQIMIQEEKRKEAQNRKKNRLCGGSGN